MPVDPVEGRPDEQWVDDGWTHDDFDIAQPIGESVSMTTVKPHTPLLEFYPGIAIKSLNPSVFACSRDDFYFAPHPTNCQKYFICFNYQLREHQCGNGLQFDFALSQCEFIERAKCFSRIQQIQNERSPSFAETMPAPVKHEIDSNGGAGSIVGVEGELDPHFGNQEGIVDRDDPDFMESDEAMPKLPGPIDADFTVGPGHFETSEELDGDFGVAPGHSDELDGDFTVRPGHKEVSGELDSDFTVRPGHMEASEELDSGFSAHPSANDTNEEIDHDFDMTPSSIESDKKFTVGMPEWDDVPDSNESNITYKPSKNQRKKCYRINST